VGSAAHFRRHSICANTFFGRAKAVIQEDERSRKLNYAIGWTAAVILAATFDGATYALHEEGAQISPGAPVCRIQGLFRIVQVIIGRINRIAYLEEKGDLWRRQQVGVRRLRGFFARRRWTGKNWSGSGGFWILCQ
jgi:hypothetical protein